VNVSVFKFIKQTFLKIKEQTDPDTIIVVDLNNPSHEQIEHPNQNCRILELNKIIDEIDLTSIQYFVLQ
jgi:hypothetical protein